MSARVFDSIGAVLNYVDLHIETFDHSPAAIYGSEALRDDADRILSMCPKKPGVEYTADTIAGVRVIWAEEVAE